MKYQQPEHELLFRRRRRDKTLNTDNVADDSSGITQNFSIAAASPPVTPTRKGASKGHSSSIDSNASSGGSSSILHSDSPSRRLSSPFVSHQLPNVGDVGDATDIVTASLKLPVQMATTSTPLNLAADIPDIPYIEDGETTFASNSMTVRSNKPMDQSSLSRSYTTSQYPTHSQPMSIFNVPTGGDSHFTPAASTSFRPPASSTSGNRNTPLNERESTSSSMIEKSISLSAIAAKGSSYRPRPIDSSYSTEPKLTASITNIGGDVLRSKTADFERLLMQQNRRSSKSSTTFEPSASSGTDERQLISSSSEVPNANTFKHSNINARRSGPIYKRRDVISSAQTLKK